MELETRALGAALGLTDADMEFCMGKAEFIYKIGKSEVFMNSGSVQKGKHVPSYQTSSRIHAGETEKTNP